MFHAEPRLGLSEDAAEAAYFAGLDRIPWPGSAEYRDGLLRIRRDGEQSGYLTIPIKTRSHGQLALSTGTLTERNSPYDLLIELARGRVGLLRNQAAEWQNLGLSIPDALVQQIDRATEVLARAIVSKGEERHTQAWESLHLALQASADLCQRYLDQAIAVRRIVARGKLPFWMGVTLGEVPPEQATTELLASWANAAIGSFSWRQGEPAPGEYCFDVADRQLYWCRQLGFQRGLGPLIDLRGQGLPAWVNLDQPWSLIQNSAFAFVEAAVRRYRIRIDLWEVAGPLNVPTALPLPEDKLAMFVAGLIQHVRNLDTGAVIALSVRQPWLEDLRFRECQYPAPFVVDALVRAGVGLDALILEVDLGYVPQGTFVRDALEWHRQLEYWAQLGLPLYVRFCAPSQFAPDPLALGQARPVQWDWSPEEQARWTNEFFLMALAKTFVKGFLWSSVADYQPHEFPHSGLFDLTRRPKPVTDLLARLKEDFLR